MGQQTPACRPGSGLLPAQPNDRNVAVSLRPIPHVLGSLDRDAVPGVGEVLALERLRVDRYPPPVAKFDRCFRLLGEVVQPGWVSGCAHRRGDDQPGVRRLLDVAEYGTARLSRLCASGLEQEGMQAALGSRSASPPELAQHQSACQTGHEAWKERAT